MIRARARVSRLIRDKLNFFDTRGSVGRVVYKKNKVTTQVDDVQGASAKCARGDRWSGVLLVARRMRNACRQESSVLRELPMWVCKFRICKNLLRVEDEGSRGEARRSYFEA